MYNFESSWKLLVWSWALLGKHGIPPIQRTNSNLRLANHRLLVNMKVCSAWRKVVNLRQPTEINNFVQIRLPISIQKFRSQMRPGSLSRYLCHCIICTNGGVFIGGCHMMIGNIFWAFIAKRLCTVAKRSVPKTKFGSAAMLGTVISIFRSRPNRSMN